MKKSPIEDMDLISARKAALGWKEDAEIWKDRTYHGYAEIAEQKRLHPTFLIVGVMIGVLGVLLAAQII